MDQEVALKRLNEQTLEFVKDEFLFEMNNEETRSYVVKLVTEYLGSQVYEPVVTCDETNNTPEVIANHGLVVDFRFKFTESDEQFTDGSLTVPEGAYTYEQVIGHV